HVLESLKTDGQYDPAKLKFFHWRYDPFMPVEFSVAADRLGHTMIRPGYRLNDNDNTLLPIFPVPDKNFPEGLTGFRAMNPACGQGVARAVGVQTLDDEQIGIGKAVDDPEDGDVLGPIDQVDGLAPFKGNCPLWTYILAEAAQNKIEVSLPVKEEKRNNTPQ